MMSRTDCSAVVFTVFAMGVGGCGVVGGGTDVPTLRGDWSDDAYRLLIRMDVDGGDDLFLVAQAFGSNERDPITQEIPPDPLEQAYRYDRSEQRFVRVSEEAWLAAEGEIVHCRASSGDETVFSIERGSRRFRFGEQDVPVTGTAFDVVAGKAHDVVAVISTLGFAPVPFFFLSTVSTGQHFHSVYSLVDGAKVGSSLRLPFTRFAPVEADVCWSANDEYVVYTNYDLRPVAVVRTLETIRDGLPSREADAPCFAFEFGKVTDAALLARDSVEAGTLLLTVNLTDRTRCARYGCDSYMGDVIEFDPVLGTFEAVDRTRWLSERTPIRTLSQTRNLRATPYQITEDDDHRLLYGETELIPAGGTPVAVVPAPDRSMVAVLSTDGVVQPSPRGASGQLYHQLFSEIDGSPLGPALRLSVGGASGLPTRVRWNPDERFVIYFSSEFANPFRSSSVICVAPIGEDVLRDTQQRTSDIPVAEPGDWPNEPGRMLVRSDARVEGALILTHQTVDQFRADRDLDGLTRLYQPHGVVYRYDPSTQGLTRADDELWDEAQTEVTDCVADRRVFFDPADVSIEIISCDPSLVEFRRTPIDVAGGSAVRVFYGTTGSTASILSTDGFITECGESAPGQHFHQVYSEIDGTPIGPVLRLGIGGLTKRRPDACWTRDDRFVIYFQGDLRGPAIEQLWIVPVEEP